MIVFSYTNVYLCRIKIIDMKIRNNYNIREIAGVTVLVPSSVVGKSGVKTASLNATGLWLMKALEGKTDFTVDDAVDLMCGEYGIDRNMAVNDVNALLGALRQCGFLDE